MIDRVMVRCPHCGEENELELDYSAGRHQEFIEDCWVCCRPIQYSVSLNNEEMPQVQAEQAY